MNDFINLVEASSDWDGWVKTLTPERRLAVEDALQFSTLETQDADRKRFLAVTRIAQETKRDPFEVSSQFESHYQPQFATAIGKPEIGTDLNTFFGELVNRDRSQRERAERRKFSVLSGAQSALFSDNKIAELSRFVQAKPEMDEEDRKAWTESFAQFDSVLREHRALLSKSGKALESMSRRNSTDEDKKVVEDLLDVVASKEGRDREILMQAILIGAEEVGQRAKENKGKKGEVVPEANGIPSHLKDAGGARGAAATFGGAAMDLIEGMFIPGGARQQSALASLDTSRIPTDEKIDSPEKAREVVAQMVETRMMQTQSAAGDAVDMFRPQAGGRTPTEEESALLQAEIDRQSARIKTMRELKQLSRKADPFDESILGKMASGTATTLSLALPLALGPGGAALAAAGYANIETEELLTEFPEMKVEDAEQIGVISGAIQAALDKATLFGLDKFAPNIRQILIGNGTRDLIKKSIGKGVALVGFENVVEAAQDATTPVVQQIVADLSQSVPGVDWNKEWKEFAGSRDDVFIGMLPLMLLGLGVNTALDRNSQRKLLEDDAAMRRMGFVQEDRVAVAEALANDDVEGAKAILNEAMDRRDPALAAEAGNEYADQQIAAYQFQKRQIEEAERRGLIPEIRPLNDGTFRVTDKESGESVIVSRDEATAMAYESLNEQERKSSEVVARLAEELSTPGDQIVIGGQRQTSETVVDEGLMKPDEVAAGVEAAAALSGMDPTKASSTTMAILGFNRFEQIENARVAVSRIFGGGNVATVIEEVVHGRWKRGLEGKVFTREQGLAWVRNAERTINTSFLPEGVKDEDVTPRLLAEAVAAVTVADLIGNRKTGGKISAGLISSGLAAFVRSERNLGVGTTAAERKASRATSEGAEGASVFSMWLRAWKGFFGNVLKAAKRMREAKEKGMLGEDHDAFLDQMWGLDGDVLEQQREAEALRDLNDEVETLASMVPRLDSRLMNGMIRSDDSAQANQTLTSAISALHRLGGGDVGAAGTADVVKALVEAGVKRVSGIEEVDPEAIEGKSGTEHATWATPSGRIIKALLTPGVATEGVLAGSKFGMNLRLDDYLTRFAMGNVLFGDDARLEGIDDQGRIYVSQPFYGGRGSEGKDTYKAMTGMGWLSNRNSSFSYISPNRMLFIEDLHAKNASISDDGHFMPFDILFFTSEQMSFWTDPDEFMEAYERDPQSLTEFWNGINKIEDLGFEPDPVETAEFSMAPQVTIEQIEASVAPVVTVDEVLWTSVDQSQSFPTRKRAQNDVMIKTPVGDEPSKMSPPRVNIYDPIATVAGKAKDKKSKPYILPPGLAGISDRESLVAKLNEQMSLMHSWSVSSPDLAAASLRFYSGMGDAGYDLAGGDIDAADLYLRWFAFLSPRASVISNAAKAIGGGASAFASEFTPGFKAGTVNQVLGMSTIVDEWRNGEAFAMHLNGVDNKVRNFYLNGASELLHKAIRLNLDPDTILNLAKKLATSLSVSVKTAGGVEVKVETMDDIEPLRRELDRLVTSDMWDQAALGNVRAGFVIGEVLDNKKTNYIWVDPRPEAGRIVSVDSAEGLQVLDWHNRYGENKKNVTSWSDLSPQELDTLDFDPEAQTIRIYSPSEDGAALLAAGGEGPTYDISQALSGMMADIINASGGMAGKQVWTAYNVQEYRWGMEKVKNPRKSMRDFSSYDEVVTALKDLSTAFEDGTVEAAATKQLNKSLDDLKAELAAETDKKKAESIRGKIRSTELLLGQLQEFGANTSRGRDVVSELISTVEGKDMSKALGSVSASELAYATQARQLMPFELQSEEGGKLYKTVFDEVLKKLAQRGETDPARTLLERVAGPGFLEGMQKALNEARLPINLRSVMIGTGSYRATMSPNLVFEMSGPRWATSMFNIALTEALEQTGGNLIRNPSITERLGGKGLTTVMEIALPESYTDDQILQVMTELGQIQDSQGRSNEGFIGGHTVLTDQDGDPVIAIHGGFYDGDFAVELESALDKVSEAANRILGLAKVKISKKVVDSYENSPQQAYQSGSGRRRNRKDESTPEGERQSGRSDGFRRDAVARLRSYVLSRVTGALGRSAKPNRGVERADPISRMTDLIGRSWDAMNLKRAGEKFKVPEDVRILTGETDIKAAVLPALSALAVSEGLDDQNVRGVSILLWDIAQRVARDSIGKVTVKPQVSRAELDEVNQQIINGQADFIASKGRMGFKVFGDGRFKLPKGFGLVEHQGERILVNIAKAREQWKRGEWDDNIIRDLATANPKIKTGIEVAGLNKAAYGYAFTYDAKGKPVSSEAIDETTGQRMLGSTTETEDEALASMVRQPLAAVAQSLLDKKSSAPTYRKALFDIAKARLGDLRRDGEWRVDKWGRASKREGMDSKTEGWVERKKSQLDREQQFREGMEYDRLLRETFGADTQAKQEALPPVDRQAARSEAKTAAMKWRKAEEAKIPSAKEKQMAALRTLGALLSAFPPKIKGQVMGFEKLASLSTDKAREAEIARRIDILDDVVEKEARKEYGAEMERLLERTRPKRESGQKPKGRFGSSGSDIHSLFNTIEQAMRWTSDKANGYADGLDKSIASGDLNAEEEEHARIEAEMVRMVADWYPRSEPTERKDKAGRTIYERVHEGADSARMQVAVEEMERLVKGAYERAKAEAIMRRERQKAKRLIMRAQAGSAGTPRQRDDEQIRRNRLGDWFRSMSMGMLSFEGALEWVFGPNSAEAQEFADRERMASNQKEDEMQAKTEALSDLFTDLAGGSTLKGEKLRYDMGQKTVSVRDRKLSQLEMITASLMWSQHDGRRHMRGHLDEDGKPIGAWHYDQDFMDDLESQLTAEAKAVRQFLIDQYGTEWADLNKVFRRLNGINLPKHENYAPIRVMPAQGEKGVMNDPTTGMSMGNSSTPGSLRSRSGHIAEPDFKDALQVFISHTKQMAHWKAYAELVSDMRPILLNREVTNSITAATSEQASKVLSNWLDFFERGGTRDASAFMTLSESMGRASSRAATVALVGRVGTLLIQSTQLGAAVTQMPAKEYAKRLAMLFAGQLDWSGAINSDYIQRRIRQMPPVVQQALEGLAATEPSRLKHEIARVGRLLSSTDGLFTAGTYAIIYDYHFSEAKGAGLDDAEAKERATKIAERLTDRAAQPTRPGARSLFENTASNPWLRLSWNFASEGRKNIGLMLSAGREGMTSARFAKAVLFTLVINSGLAWIIRTAWKDLRDDEDDEIFDAEHWSLKRMALAMSTEWMSGIPAMGAMLQAAVYGAAGEWAPEGNLFSGAARAAKVAANDLPKLLDGELTTAEILRDTETILAGLAVAMPTSLGADSVAAAASLSHIIRDVVEIADNAGFLETD